MKIFSDKGASENHVPTVRTTAAMPLNGARIPIFRGAHKLFWAAILICASHLPAAKAVKDDGALILERANSNENIYSSASKEFVSHLRGNVVFRYEGMRISSDEATWQKNKGIVDFRKNVKVVDKGQVMTCDRLHFVRENKLLTATGSVFYKDSSEITFISGNNAEYRTDTKEAKLWGSPQLKRLDSAAVSNTAAGSAPPDTLFISGRTMIYSDSLKIATVINNVVIRQGDLRATCRKSDYHAKTGMALLRIQPVIYYENHRVVGDSIDLSFENESLRSANVMGNTHVHYTEAADSAKKDTTVTNVWSDSLYLSMFETGKMNYMKAFGNARGSYSEASASSSNAAKTDITSDSIQLFMFETGKVRIMKAYGNAHGKYSEKTAAAGSAMNTDITGDSLQMHMFETGKVRAMKAFGNARGKYSESSAAGGAVSTDITSDSMHIFMFEAGKIRAMKAFGNTHGRSVELVRTQPDSSSQPQTASAPQSDSTITHIWSDSLRIMLSETGKMKTMKAFGNAQSINFLKSDSTRINEVTGQTMTIAFTATGQIEKALVKGNAQSSYFLDDSEGGGRNETSGEQILVAFTAGKARRLKVRGNVKGFYAP